MKIKDILIHDNIKTSWIDLCPQDETGDDSDLQLLSSSHIICMVDWCEEEYNFWPTDINLSSPKENWLEEEVVKKGLKWFTLNCLVAHNMTSRERKRALVHILVTGFINSHCSMPIHAPNSVNKIILNLSIGQLLIKECMSLSQEQSCQVREIRISICLKSHMMKTWLKKGKLGNRK